MIMVDKLPDIHQGQWVQEEDDNPRINTGLSNLLLKLSTEWTVVTSDNRALRIGATPNDKKWRRTSDYALPCPFLPKLPRGVWFECPDRILVLRWFGVINMLYVVWFSMNSTSCHPTSQTRTILPSYPGHGWRSVGLRCIHIFWIESSREFQLHALRFQTARNLGPAFPINHLQAPPYISAQRTRCRVTLTNGHTETRLIEFDLQCEVSDTHETSHQSILNMDHYLFSCPIL